MKQLQVALSFGAVALLSACQAQGASPVTPSYSFSSTQGAVENTTGQSVAYQINAEHTGSAKGPLLRPLKKLWSINLGGGIYGYPVIANGIVVANANDTLLAFDEKTGKKLWKQVSPGKGSFSGWAGVAYDNGEIFADQTDTSGSKRDSIYAFDERTGKKLWSSPSPRQYFFSPPTAANKSVYLSGDGLGGTVYAYDESTGALNWAAQPGNGSNTSLAVTATGAFVSYSCPQTYDFQPGNGKTIWHYKGPCSTGGGTTPVVYDGLVFVGASQVSTGYNGLILKATNGTVVGGFNSSRTPAFANGVGLFVNGSTLDAQSVPSMKNVWSVTIESYDGVGFSTPPLVVGNIVYAETAEGLLLGYDVVNGKQKVKITLPESIYYEGVSPSLAYGDGELVVPNGPYLVAFQGSRG